MSASKDAIAAPVCSDADASSRGSAERGTAITLTAGEQGAGRCIGIFDSGIGGLSVLRSVQQRLPHARLIYVADSGHAPYGERGDDAFIVARCRVMAAHLIARGAEVIVVACNTATAAAAQMLRQTHPQVPIVGVEPGLKPAIARTRNGRVGVMATPATLASAKFARLLDEQKREGIALYLQPCPGLAAAIERGAAGAQGVRLLVERYAAPLRNARVDTVALGCTHYPFAAREIAAALGGGVLLIDTADAVAQEAARRLAILATVQAAAAPPDIGETGGAGRVELFTSGQPQALRSFARHWLGIDAPVRALPGA